MLFHRRAIGRLSRSLNQTAIPNGDVRILEHRAQALLQLFLADTALQHGLQKAAAARAAEHFVK